MNLNYHQVSEALLHLVESLQPALEAVAGYRNNCEEHGFSPTTAELMATEFHRHLLAGLFAQAQQQGNPR